jgi:triosephosphate isomerase
MREPVIAGNWKMYKLLAESVETALQLKSVTANVTHCEIVVAPVFTALKSVADKVENSNIKIAAQDCSTEIEHGAHTGEVAADMIKDVGAEFVIIAHSERRQFYGETSEIANKKNLSALNAGLQVIYCVGETLQEREGNLAQKIVEQQLKEGLRNLTTLDMNRIIIAYEPVWAIGTGKTATPEQAQEMHGFIRQVLIDQHNQATAESTRILYGGSVKPENIRALMAQSDIDGALVGGASLAADSFAQIINYK